MSVLLFVVGAIVTMLGIGMAGYGIPINEFSFGNTLIVAGTTATVGGLIIIGIAATVGKLRRIIDALGEARMPMRPSRRLEMVESPVGARAAAKPDQFPFPPKPGPAAHEPPPVEAPASAVMPSEDRVAASFAPTLPNPEMPPVTVSAYEVEEYKDVSLSLRQTVPDAEPAGPGEPTLPPPTSAEASPAADQRPESEHDAPWHFSSTAPPESQPESSYFDSMWPAEPKPAKRPIADKTMPEPPPPSMVTAPHAPSASPPSEPPVAILKSGVVDGMGYTLYVDGSIEAELPQGTLRFASINELRNYLARNS